MRNVAGLFLGSVVVTMVSTGCVAQVTDSSGNGGSNSGTGASGGSSSGVGLGGSGGAGTAGTGGAATAGTGGAATAGTGGTASAGKGGTTSAGTGGTATAGTGGTGTAGNGGTATAGSGGTTTAGTGGTGTAGSGGTATAGSGGTGTAGTTGKGGSAGTGAGGTGAGGTAAVCPMRIAHLACDAGGAVDVCIRAKGVTSWTDTTVQRFFKDSQDADAFYYPAVSVYFDVDEGDYEVRLIDNTATDCNMPYDAMFKDTTISVKPGSHYTLALEGKSETHTLFFQLIKDDANPSDGTVGFQALNALVATPGNLNFCLQQPNPVSISTVTTGIVPLGPAKSQGNTQSVPSDTPPDDRRALMFLDATDSMSIAISDYTTLYGDDEYFAFVAGTSTTETMAELLPQVIVCKWDSTNAGNATHATIASSCGYYKQTTPSNPLRVGRRADVVSTARSSDS